MTRLFSQQFIRATIIERPALNYWPGDGNFPYREVTHDTHLRGPNKTFAKFMGIGSADHWIGQCVRNLYTQDFSMTRVIGLFSIKTTPNLGIVYINRSIYYVWLKVQFFRPRMPFESWMYHQLTNIFKFLIGWPDKIIWTFYIFSSRLTEIRQI